MKSLNSTEEEGKEVRLEDIPVREEDIPVREEGRWARLEDSPARWEGRWAGLKAGKQTVPVAVAAGRHAKLVRKWRQAVSGSAKLLAAVTAAAGGGSSSSSAAAASGLSGGGGGEGVRETVVPSRCSIEKLDRPAPGRHLRSGTV